MVPYAREQHEKGHLVEGACHGRVGEAESEDVSAGAGVHRDGTQTLMAAVGVAEFTQLHVSRLGAYSRAAPTREGLF